MRISKQTFTQNAFLHEFLRGTGRSLTVNEARNVFGIKSLRARISELRSAGLRVRREPTDGRAVRYAISAKDVNGSRASIVQ